MKDAFQRAIRRSIGVCPRRYARFPMGLPQEEDMPMDDMPMEEEKPMGLMATRVHSMGFDAQAFATAFLEGQAKDIKEKFAKAEKLREEELAINS